MLFTDWSLSGKPGVPVMTTKKISELTLQDRLSRLEFTEACKLLGENGRRLISKSGDITIDIENQVRMTENEFRVHFGWFSDDSGDNGNHSGPEVVLQLSNDARRQIRWTCSACDIPCEHAGATFSLLLEEKTALGLAKAPPERIVAESLSEEELVQRAIEERRKRAREEKMKLKTADSTQPWTDYIVTSELSGKSYRVALRGTEPGDSYCSCPDFRTNTLGTCKHILKVLRKVQRAFPPAVLKKAFKPKQIGLHLCYQDEVTLRWELPPKLSEEAEGIVGAQRDRPLENVSDVLRRVSKLEQLGQPVTIYPDAEEFIQQRLFQKKIEQRVADIRRDVKKHPLRKELLKIELLPYQLDGIAFAVGAGRAILADDMGLGKTIQGVGTAELLAREASIKKVLVICPASLKSQWRNEIHRFCDRDVQLVVGSVQSRLDQYSSECFFTLCNYEQVLRDILAIERVPWDLIILDEGQRIKNWETKTTRVVKGLKSRFALVLSGTPLENRLDELYSVVQFIDDRRLGPGFRFFNRHRMTDENGKVLGFKNLAELRENLKPVLLRRTRESVMQQLPPRSSEIIRIPPTDEQLALHNAHMQVVATIVRKPFISEMDLLRLRQALLMCRMSANGTFLVDKKEPNWSTKLDYLDDLVDRLFQEEDRKAVLFSEWTTMLNLIEPLLKKRRLRFVRLDGGVPQKKRQELVQQFQTQSDCRLFISTNAGSTGLNLQAANTVINIDLPWNPAILEQRIGRAHRMGQTRPVQVFVLITEQTIEENLLQTLSAKHDLAVAALDTESEVNEVEMQSGMQDLKSRLEVLLGAKPIAPVDETLKATATEDARQLAHRERVAAAGGEMLGAAFHFLGELVAHQAPAEASSKLVTDLKSRLAECVEEDPSGRQRLTVTLPDKAALDNLAQTLAKLLAAGEGS
jgi:superfamily II DNA or RNA helicase